LPGPEEFAMSKVHPVPSVFAAAEQIKPGDYQRLYAESLRDPETFWANAAKRLDWMKPPQQIKDVSFDPRDLHIRWYADGVLNPTVSCLDRQLDKRGDKTAILFEGDDPNVSRAISYRELHAEVCKFANALKHHGVKKGDRIAIY
jgi:acetyl-CoA synthetase